MYQSKDSATILTLGTAQDGGYPHTGCAKECCVEVWNNPMQKRLVSSQAIISGDDCWLIDITPDLQDQLKMIERELNSFPDISGIFITHAHIGHYLGLLELGLEVMNTHDIPVYVMPRMKVFLEENAPFTQLIELNNIQLKEIEEDITFQLNKNLSITPFQVPHRNEFSETVGYRVQSIRKSIFYIPDIDSWKEWNIDINDLIKVNDIAILDGTFYDKSELQSRDVASIPHPSILESMGRFSILDKIDRKKVYFTHFNHTNKVLHSDSRERLEVISKGYQISMDGMKFSI